MGGKENEIDGQETANSAATPERDGNRESRKAKPRAAVSYSPQVGGLTVKSVFKVFEDAGADVMHANYLNIMGIKLPSLDEIEVPANIVTPEAIAKFKQEQLTKLYKEAKKEYDSVFEDKNKLLVCFRKAKANAAIMLDEADCLVIPGNESMVDPLIYGKDRKNENIDSSKIDNIRMIAEMAMLHVAMQRGMPVLGICGGHQVINVYLGGEVSWLSSENMKKQKMDEYGEVVLLGDSELSKIAYPNRDKSEKLIVERFFGSHNQAVSTVGGKNVIAGGKDYLKVTARAKDTTGTIEAVESQYGSPLFGLQFHPEVAIEGFKREEGEIYQEDSKDQIKKNQRIIAYFVAAAQSFRDRLTITPGLLKKEIANRKKRAAKLDENTETKQQGKNADMHSMHAEAAHRVYAHERSNKRNTTKDSAKKSTPSRLISTMMPSRSPDMKGKKKVKTRNEKAEALANKRVVMLNAIEKKKSEHKKQNNPLPKPIVRGIFQNVTMKAEVTPEMQAQMQIQLDKMQKEGLNRVQTTDDQKDFYRAKCEDLLEKCHVYMKHIDKEINKQSVAGNSMKILLEKKKELNQFIKKVEKSSKSITKKDEINTLFNDFSKNYTLYKTNTDTASETFVKGAISFFAVIFVVGIVALPFIWRNKNSKHINAIKREFNK